jgi:hypothetical protein
VDPDVLNELPVHLQRQIRAAIQRRNNVTNQRNNVSDALATTSINIADDVVRPGCSHWSIGAGDGLVVIDDVKSGEQSRDRKENDEHDELPSFSQVGVLFRK